MFSEEDKTISLIRSKCLSLTQSKTNWLGAKIFNFSFTYNSNNISLKTGDLVEVPFGPNKKEIGVVWKDKVTDLKNIKIFAQLILKKFFI